MNNVGQLSRTGAWIVANRLPQLADVGSYRFPSE